MILLAENMENDANTWYDTLPVTVRRNAYGRQLGSFITTAPVKGVGDVKMNFIRAPYIESVSGGAKALAIVGGKIVAARQDNQLVTAFHPELDENTAIHEYFLKM